MKKAGVIMTVVFLMCGCAAQQVVSEREKNSRIVYRDLTRPKQMLQLDVFPELDELKVPPKPQVAGYRPEYFIEFASGSSSRFDKNGLQAFLAGTDLQSHILLVGHSHGNRGVGTLRLASKRVEAIARHLTGQGYQNVHVMAFWGAAPVWFAPARGVQVFMMGKNPDPADVPIIFAYEVQEKQKDSPQDFMPIADSVATGHPGDV
jgi:hypothetical protein